MSPPAHADEVIGALVRLAAADGADDPDALLVLLHLLSGGVHALAAKLAHLSDNILHPGGRRTDLPDPPLPLAAAHPGARQEPAARHQTSAAPRRTPGRPARPTGAWCSIDPHDPAFRRLDVAHTENDDVDVVDLLLWAGGHGVAPLQDLLMLLDLERRRGYGTATRHRVADDLGINERTVRRRRDRALTALRQAGPTYLAAVA